jgi:hypothetical protein
MPLMKVQIRRDSGLKVRPEAEQIDGKCFDFIEGWYISEEDSSIYVGETAMIPRHLNTDYPYSAPDWIASGDLVLMESTNAING